MFRNCKPHLEDYIAVCRISKFPLDKDLWELKNRHFAPLIYFFFKKSLVHDFTIFQLSDWNKSSYVLFRQYSPEGYFEKPQFIFIFIFWIFMDLTVFRHICLCIPGYADHFEGIISKLAPWNFAYRLLKIFPTNLIVKFHNFSIF